MSSGVGATARRIIDHVPAVWRRVGLATGGLIALAVGGRIVAPRINGQVLGDYLRTGGGSVLLKLYDWLVGGALSRGALLALGIMPYVSASVVVRLARIVSPEIDALHEHEAGRARLSRWTSRLTFGLALVQSYGFARFVQTVPGAVAEPGAAFIAQTMIVLTTGAMGVAWLARRLRTRSDADDPMPIVEPAPDAQPAVTGASDVRMLPPGELPMPEITRRAEPIVVDRR